MLSLGLVGPPNAGKSTIFNALTAQSVLIADYPFATIEPNIGLVNLPDPRLEQLAKVFNSQEVKPATVSFFDIAGLVSGASQGQGLGNAFLSHIRQTTAIVLVLRTFEIGGQPATPVADRQMIDFELRLADQQTLEKNLNRLTKTAKQSTEAEKRLQAVKLAIADLEEGPLRESPNQATYQESLADLGLLTLKPLIHLFNLLEKDQKNQKLKENLAANLAEDEPYLFISASFELEISQLPVKQQADFLADYDLQESGIDRLAQVGFATLGLQTFLTVGQQEAKAWTIKKGQTAKEAAAAIHSDISRGFIMAEVANWGDLVAAGTWSAAKAAGQVRQEGRDYQLADGEVVFFKFNTTK